MICPICSWTKDNPEYLFLCETPYWIVKLAPNQCLPGRCVISTNRHVGDLAALTPDEMLDLLSLIRRVESALRQSFDATMFNWACYMNHSYREEIPDPHVHWWVVPRYRCPVQIGSMTFEDPHFGSPYDHNRWLDIPARLKETIARTILAHLLPM